MGRERQWIKEAAAGNTDLEEQLLHRWHQGEPLQYVLGEWSFRRLNLKVDRRVLIPRPETEVVAGFTIDEAKNKAQPVVVDLGTGSGAIALSVATEVPGSRVYGVDASADALAVARGNDPTGLVAWLAGDWFAALPPGLEGTVDVIVSNPPYVAEDDDLPSVVRDWEPYGALVAGPRGTEALEHIISAAFSWLAPAGSLVLEMAPHQTEAMCGLARNTGYELAVVHSDLAGRPRCVVARKGAS